MRAVHTVHGFAAFVLLLAGCGATVRVARPGALPSDAIVVSEARMGRCPRSPGGLGHTYRDDLPGPVTDPALVRLLEPLGPDARRTAVAAGVEPLVAAVLQERERVGGAPDLALVAMRQELDEALASLSPQLLAMELEAECVIALISQTLATQQDEETDRSLLLTVASLVVGAASSLGAGIWDLAGTDSNGPVIVGLAGAGATTGLGIATLVPRDREIVFLHEHNLLGPMIRGDDPDRAYPTFVFRMFTLPRGASAPTPRDELVAGWRALLDEALDPDDRATAAAVLGSDGGVYDSDLLTLRRRLFEELETTLDSFAREIDLLARSIGRALREAAPAGLSVLGAPPSATAPAR